MSAIKRPGVEVDIEDFFDQLLANISGDEDAGWTYEQTIEARDWVRAKLEDLNATAAPKAAIERIAELEAENVRLREEKDVAYLERNRLVALLASVFPAVRRSTAIEGWEPEWHGCVYVDLPTGQVSWHYHDSQAGIFAHVPEGEMEWDGHTTEQKYERVMLAARRGESGEG